MNCPSADFKKKTHGLVEQFPETANWKELAYEGSVLQDIEEGLRDSNADRVVDNEAVRRQFGLD